jgi:hypothetical protein
LPVVRIVRIRIGSLTLGTLKPAEWRHLTEGEVAELKGEKISRQEPSERGNSLTHKTHLTPNVKRESHKTHK